MRIDMRTDRTTSITIAMATTAMIIVFWLPVSSVDGTLSFDSNPGGVESSVVGTGGTGVPLGNGGCVEIILGQSSVSVIKYNKINFVIIIMKK